MEIEVAKENEVVKLSGIGTVKGVGFLSFGTFRSQCGMITVV